MSRKTNSLSAGQPSFYYLMMARCYFDRARKAGHRKGTGLRGIGRDYLVKATTFESQHAKPSAGVHMMSEAA
jgi:hypothetical protein